MSFNGANFDNYLVLSAVSNVLREESGEWSANNAYLSRVFFFGSSLMNFFLDGGISCFDLARHLVGSSLDSLCKSFQTHYRKQSGLIDHQETARRFREKGWDFLKDEDFLTELYAYNKGDVTSLAELFYTYVSSPLNDSLRHVDFPGTIGSLTFKTWVNDFDRIVKPYVEQMPKEMQKFLKCCKGWEPLDSRLYWGLRDSILAGRVELFNGPAVVEEAVMSLDVTSLYPYVMSVAPVYYPFGTVTETGPGERHPAGLLGFYRVNVDQTALLFRNLPNIVAYKIRNSAGIPYKNDWRANRVLDIWVGSPIFELLLEYQVDVEILEGFYYSHKMKSCEMFGCLVELMKEKNRQDQLKASRDPNYNPAMRQMCKLRSNSLYGKMIEGLHLTNKKETSAEEFYETLEAIERGESDYESINTLDVVGKLVFAEFEYKRDTEKKLKGQRPIAVGMFILEYARCYMYRHAYAILGMNKLLYTDTDCFKFRAADFPIVRTYMESRLVPHWPELEQVEPAYVTQPMWAPDSKQYGSFEDELPKDNTGIALCAKKFYAILKGDGIYMEDGAPMIGAKGVRLNDVVLTDAQAFELAAVKDPKTRNEVYRLMYERDDAPRIRTHGRLFFDQLFRTGMAHVLTNGLRRCATNLVRGVTPEQTTRHNSTFGKLLNTYAMKRFQPEGMNTYDEEALVEYVGEGIEAQYLFGDVDI